MAGVARKAPAKRKAKSPSPRQKVLQSSWVDMLIRALPLSEQDVQRIITWIILVAFTLLAFVAAQYAGLTAAAYQQYAALAAKAGFEVQRVEVTGMERVDQLKVYQLVLAEKDRAMPLVDIDKVRADLLTILHRLTHLLPFHLLRVNGLLVKQQLMRVVLRQLCKVENQVSR